jgi:hypothetical protein
MSNIMISHTPLLICLIDVQYNDLTYPILPLSILQMASLSSSDQICSDGWIYALLPLSAKLFIFCRYAYHITCPTQEQIADHTYIPRKIYRYSSHRKTYRYSNAQLNEKRIYRYSSHTNIQLFQVEVSTFKNFVIDQWFMVSDDNIKHSVHFIVEQYILDKTRHCNKSFICRIFY